MELKKRGFQKGTHLLLAPDEQAEIRETIITRRPEEFGIPGSLWTLKKVCAYVWKRYRKKILDGSVSDYMRRWGLTPAPGRKHIQPLSFRLHWLNWGRPFGCKPALTVRAAVDSSLVSPANHGIFCPGPLDDGRIFLVSPPLDTGRLLFSGTLDRTLAGQSPAPHIIRHTAV